MLFASGACGRPLGGQTEKSSHSQALSLGTGPFLWGVSTAGYQWEGQDNTSQWAAFDAAGKTAERNLRGADGLVRYDEDLRLARGLGCNAFRTSIEWSRIEPREGQRDPAAIAHYHSLLRSMRAEGLEPIITLMHFSYPAWLDAQGGWEGQAAPKAFARHVAFIAKEFGQEVRWWLTFNEPNIFLLGWLTPAFPPGKRNSLGAVRVVNRLVEAHQDAYDAIHAHDPDAMVSFNMYTAEWSLGQPPLGRVESASEQTERRLLEEETIHDAFGRGGRKVDYAALDYYAKIYLSLPVRFPRPDQWEVHPEGLYKAIKRFYVRYKLPVLIAENGMATGDLAPRSDGWTRAAYLRAHIAQVQRAQAQGVPVIGYVHWSITDNYEWGSFSPRFGLFSVDCRQQRFTRVRTEGADAYAELIRMAGLTRSQAP
ncbi:MAG: family 1 glycosylhydrolase [Candidatus Sericytochromatia bacterium]|nr:family 1 glycosylhydrolase [Candidatus Sericytochromatia bacterium]